MPIRARINVLSTGIRTPVGVKVYGIDLKEMERVAQGAEGYVNSVLANWGK